MSNLLLVAAGGAVGASARHLVGLATLRVFGSGFPVGTMVVNIVGCLAMGILVGLFATRIQGSQALRLLLATGFLGGFTTFSAFSLDFTVLWDRGQIALAIGYVAASVLLSLAALAAGLWLVRTFA
jgi:CrcB protein